MTKKIITFMILFIMQALSLTAPQNSDDISARIEMVTPQEKLRYGDEVELRCIVEGEDPDECSIYWQYLTGKDDYWRGMECTGERCVFILTEENAGYYYRVLITY